MAGRMRAVVIDAPGEADVLQLREVPLPRPDASEVRIAVRAFGLNRSELHFRSGQAYTGSFPRIPGIEAVGVVDEAPGGQFEPGTQVMTMSGEMGRVFDGGYAEYVVVPAEQVIAFRSGLPWGVLGAVPVMLQTAYGSLTVGVGFTPQAAGSLLVRGGTSSVGLAAIGLAARWGANVIATTRSASKAQLLRDAGASHVVIDDGAVADAVRRLVPDGVDGAIELVGVETLRDTLRAVRVGGTAVFTGMLADVWTVRDFYPMDFIPNGVRLTSYAGETSDLLADVLQGYLDAVEAGSMSVPVGATYRIDDIVQAHRDLEQNRHPGKKVVVLGAPQR